MKSETTKAITISQQKSTKEVVPFEPSRGMLRWFAAAVELGPNASITEVAKKAELDRSNWYLWLEKDGFVEWWDEQWGKFLRLNRWKLDAIGMKQAERNYDYWRTMMERVGNIVPEKTPATANQFNINLGDAQLRRIIED